MRRFLCLFLVAPLSFLGSGAVAVPPVGRAAATTDAIVVAVGDIACPAGDAVDPTHCQQAATQQLASSLRPRAVLAVGDLQYQNGTYAGFLGSYAKSWGKLRSITYPVVGNHEYRTAGAAGYYRYFAGRQPGSPGYYRRAINGWQVYVLNSNCDQISCARERTWLGTQLTLHPSRCSLIAMHHPRFSSGGEHGSSVAMRPFWKIASRHHVDIALSGHDHDYERFAPLDPDGKRSAAGIRQFVSGAGGKSLYAKGVAVPGSQYFENSVFGVLELRLKASSYGWRFVDTTGGVRDSGTSACH